MSSKKAFLEELNQNKVVILLETNLCPSRPNNCYALSILHGSNSLKFFPKKHLRKVYQYQNQIDEYALQQVAWLLSSLLHLLGYNQFPEVQPPEFQLPERSINDDLETFHRQIVDLGINHKNLVNERIEVFHYQMLDDNQLNELKQAIAKYNTERTFFQKVFRRYHSMEAADENHKYVQFNGSRITIYYKKKSLSNCLLL